MIEQNMRLQWESAVSIAEMGGAPEVDLHGCDVVDAEMRVERFLAESYRLGESVVKIVHGRGTGVLQDAMRRLLSNHSLVAYSRGSTNPHEQGAVMYALIANK
jgi:DNA mismatch repair protein MutS2